MSFYKLANDDLKKLAFLVLLRKYGAMNRKRRRGISPLWGVGAIPAASYPVSRHYLSKLRSFSESKTSPLYIAVRDLGYVERRRQWWEKNLQEALEKKEKALKEPKRLVRESKLRHANERIQEARKEIEKNIREAERIRYEHLPQELRSKPLPELKKKLEEFLNVEKKLERKMRIPRNLALIGAAASVPTYGYLIWRAIKRRKKRR